MSKRKLLLADDSVTIQKVVNLTFADEGIEVISVGDGDSAMNKVAEVSPDLIMADVNMPGLTGYQICERIRQDDKLSRTPVILLVGSFEPFDEEEARRVGADDYLTKPFQSIRQLVNKVTVLLESHNDNGEQKAVSSLEDTLKMDAEELSATSETSGFEDKGYDDEMIQTNQPTGFALDETPKFEYRESEPIAHSFQTDDYQDFHEQKISEPQNEESAKEFSAKPSYLAESYQSPFVADSNDRLETFENETIEFSYNPDSDFEVENSNLSDETIEEGSESEASENSLIEEVSSQTEELSKETVEFSGENSDEAAPAEYEIAETSSSQTLEDAEIDENPAESDESVENIQAKSNEEDIPLPETASVLEFDDDDILQLPPLELDFEDEEEETEPAKTFQAESSLPVVESVYPSENQAVSNLQTISPELIDEIVNKVLERLSEKAIKEVAWEVVPQMTELIVKKMAEEKLKE